MFTIPVAPGDVVIAGTDGLFDNLYNNEITAIVVHAVRAGFGPQVTAQKIAALARERAQDKNRQTPFSTAAQEAGIRYYGGKLDDITVVVSYITSDHNVRTLSPSFSLTHSLTHRNHKCTWRAVCCSQHLALLFHFFFMSTIFGISRLSPVCEVDLS